MLLRSWNTAVPDGGMPYCEALEPRLFLAATPAPGTVITGDFTGDGIVDIVTTQGGLKLRVGNGNGTFQPGVPLSAVGFARGGNLSAADFNLDGSLDITVFGGKTTKAVLQQANGGRGTSGGLFVLLNNGNGTFKNPTPYYNSVLNSKKIPGGQVMTGDFNLDGDPDILVVSAGGGTTPTTIETGTTGTAAATPPSSPFGTPGNGFFGSNTLFASNGLTGTTGQNLLGSPTTGLLGGVSQTNFFGVTGNFPTAGAPTPVGGEISTGGGVIGPPQGSSFEYLLYGNGNGTFQAPKLISLA